jgi:hypothetical protein
VKLVPAAFGRRSTVRRVSRQRVRGSCVAVVGCEAGWHQLQAPEASLLRRLAVEDTLDVESETAVEGVLTVDDAPGSGGPSLVRV